MIFISQCIVNNLKRISLRCKISTTVIHISDKGTNEKLNSRSRSSIGTKTIRNLLKCQYMLSNGLNSCITITGQRKRCRCGATTNINPLTFYYSKTCKIQGCTLKRTSSGHCNITSGSLNTHYIQSYFACVRCSINYQSICYLNCCL